MDDDKPVPGEFVPPYRYIADVLRGEILDGRYQVGERIPSQAELEERFRVSRPTIQRALGELRKDGFIDNQRGRSAEVLPWQERGAAAVLGRAEGPQPAFASLGTHVSEAFRAQHVTIDSYSLTTETLNSVLGNELQRIRTGEQAAPQSIRMRLMVPDPKAQLAFPRSATDPADQRPLRRLRRLITGHCIAIRSSFTSTRRLTKGLEVSIEFRSVPVTPLHKLYLLNGNIALFGHYKVVQRPITFDDQHWEDIFDVLGIDATLFAHRADPDDTEAAESRFVKESQEWFDSLWSTIAEPLELFE